MAVKLDATLPLTPRNTKHNRIIQRNIQFLCNKTVNILELTLHLISFAVIDTNLRDFIINQRPESEQYYAVYSHVARKDEVAFQHLLVCLKKSGNEHILKILRDCMDEEVFNMDTPDEPLRGSKSFPEVTPRKFNDIQKRDIFRFVLWGIIIAILAIITITLVILLNQLKSSTNNNNFIATTSAPVQPITIKKEETVGPPSDDAAPPIHHSTPKPLKPGIPDGSSRSTRTPTNPQNSSGLSIYIDAPFTDFPTTSDTSAKLNLTILTTKKYDWRAWQIENPDQIYSLALRGSFNESDVHYLLDYLKNVRRLSISHASYLCPELTGDMDEDQEILKIHENLEVIWISVVPECELLYKYLANSWRFPNLKTIVLERAFISLSNYPYIHDLFLHHQKHLAKLVFLNVTLCEACEIFKGLMFANLEEARFIFFNGKSAAAAKTLRNLSEVSPFMSRFYSNIPCTHVPPRVLVHNWKYIRSSSFEFCVE